MEERLQKVLARAGIASRRKAEEMITAGLVTVNGQVKTTLGEKADPRRDRIVVNGQPLPPPAAARHFLLYKPKGVVSTLSDPAGRPTVADFLPEERGRIRARLYPVGRLDYASEGLLLITNDGGLAYRVMHASSALPKTYWVKVSGRPDEQKLEKMRRGMFLPPLGSAPAVHTAPAQVGWKGGPTGKSADPNPWLEVVLTEGRPNQIRRMAQAIGHRVEKLRRVKIGPLEAGGMRPGQLRPLLPRELQALRRALVGPREARNGGEIFRGGPRATSRAGRRESPRRGAAPRDERKRGARRGPGSSPRSPGPPARSRARRGRSRAGARAGH